MIEFDEHNRPLKISIPISNLGDAARYHQSLITLLERIEIDQDTPAFIEALDCVYELMSHLLPDRSVLDLYNNPLNDS